MEPRFGPKCSPPEHLRANRGGSDGSMSWESWEDLFIEDSRAHAWRWLAASHGDTMETILVKIFATALALSQVTTTPDAVKTQFDRVLDQEQVAQLLHAGCTHLRKAFDIEDINLEELIATALEDPQETGENKVFRGINFADLQMAYREFCKNERA